MRQFQIPSSLYAAAQAPDTATTVSQEKSEWQPMADMSMKKMGCDAKQAIKQERSVYMARIFGEATDAKHKDGKNGDVYSYLMGEFRAVTAAGQKFESTKLFLPGRLIEEIESALKSTGKPVEFGYDIYSTPDDSSSVGYKYAAKAVIKTEVSNRVEKLASSVMAKPMPKDDVKK